MKFDQAMTLRLLQEHRRPMATPSPSKASAPAEQATMALDSLFVAYSKNAKLANDAQIRAGHQRAVPATGRSVRV